MPKYEIVKTIEATRLNKRTLIAMGRDKHTIPYGAIIENLTEDRDRRKFFYLNEPYQCFDWELEDAIRELK